MPKGAVAAVAARMKQQRNVEKVRKLFFPKKIATIFLHTLFRKKRFEINFFVQQNASKFAIFIEKENPRSFFRFSFRATLSFTL